MELPPGSAHPGPADTIPRSVPPLVVIATLAAAYTMRLRPNLLPAGAF